LGKIDVFRKEIDAIDSRILALLNKRGNLARKIGKEKHKANLPNFHSPSREVKILRRLSARNQGPYSNQAIHAIFREIFSAALFLEQPLRVAFLGPKATYTHLAAQKKFGTSACLLPAKSIAEIFSEVERGNVDYGIVPLENSIEGVVGCTLDLLVESPLQLVAEISQKISIHLLNTSGDLSKVRKICSHPHALAQCRIWIENNLPNVKLEKAESTAAAAQMAQGNKSVGALSNAIAAKLYHLAIAAPSVQASSNSVTRFVVISREGVERTGKDRTSLVFSVPDTPGALVKCLNIFSRKKINMTKVESRPVKKRVWAYIFFVDIDGHRDDGDVGKAISELSKTCIFLKVLGSFPRET